MSRKKRKKRYGKEHSRKEHSSLVNKIKKHPEIVGLDSIITASEEVDCYDNDGNLICSPDLVFYLKDNKYAMVEIKSSDSTWALRKLYQQLQRGYDYFKDVLGIEYQVIGAYLADENIEVIKYKSKEKGMWKPPVRPVSTKRVVRQSGLSLSSNALTRKVRTSFPHTKKEKHNKKKYFFKKEGTQTVHKNKKPLLKINLLDSLEKMKCPLCKGMMYQTGFQKDSEHRIMKCYSPDCYHVIFYKGVRFD